jgi:glycerol-3-phosphate acyltransferase PlsY
MSPASATLIASLLSYVIGSIPFGYLIARFIKGIDIRKHGSGNIGATNVGRVLGLKWGILALVLDLVKALLPTWLLPLLLVHDPAWMGHASIACGVAAIIGHMYPCWLWLRGGKGVASALGVVAYLAPTSTAIAFAVFVVTILLWRIISVSSMLAAISFAAAHLILNHDHLWTSSGWSLTLFSLAIPTLIIIRHRSNIGRLWRGEEPRFQTTREKKQTA